MFVFVFIPVSFSRYINSVIIIEKLVNQLLLLEREIYPSEMPCIEISRQFLEGIFQETSGMCYCVVSALLFLHLIVLICV